MLREGWSGPWGRRLLIGKEEPATGHLLFGGRVPTLELRDEISSRQMRMAQYLRNAQNAPCGHTHGDQRLLPFGGATFHQFRSDLLIDGQAVPPARFPVFKSGIGLQVRAPDHVT